MRRLLGGLVLVGMGVVACAGTTDDDSEGSVDDLIDKNKPPMTMQRLDEMTRGAGLKSLDQVPAALPKEFLINFTLKHGRLFVGEHGHLTEQVVSQSSSPSAPRAILWDERTGLSISYNGGKPGQTEPNRLDVLEFDEGNKTFKFAALQFDNQNAPVWQTDAEIPEPNRKCARCHGDKPRPIFSMYPDWPSFYGSDNDEMTERSKPVQAREADEYKVFRAEVVQTRAPRYLPLFDDANVRAHLRGTPIYPTWPYRPDTNTNIEAISRAFAFRASLRFGILENRQMAQSAAQTIMTHPSFAKFGAFFLHDLLECRWPSSTSLQSKGWIDAVKSEIGRAPRTVAGGRTLHYRDLLSIFDLDVRDIDIRYSHNHAGYANEDATNKVMEVGYIDNAYWNSYFDGSATIDELIAMHLYQRLSKTPGFTDLDGVITHPDSLVVKYERRAERFKFDKNFFEEMDRKGKWIPIPYPLAKLNAVHHREGFPDRFANQHRTLCAKLETHLQSPANGTITPPPVATSCPASCVASTFCKDHPNAASAIRVNGLPCVVSGAGGCQACR